MRVAIACPRGSAEPIDSPGSTIQVPSVVSLTAVRTVTAREGRRRPYVVRVLILLTCADALCRTVRRCITKEEFFFGGQIIHLLNYNIKP